MGTSTQAPTRIRHTSLSPTELNRLVRHLQFPADAQKDSTPDDSPSDEAIALVNHILASSVSHHGPLSRSTIESIRHEYTRTWLQQMDRIVSNDEAEAVVRQYLPGEIRTITCDFARLLDRRVLQHMLERLSRDQSTANGSSVASARDPHPDLTPLPRGVVSAATVYARSWFLYGGSRWFDISDADCSLEYAKTFVLEHVGFVDGLREYLCNNYEDYETDHDDDDDDDDDADNNRVEDFLVWLDQALEDIIKHNGRELLANAQGS